MSRGCDYFWVVLTHQFGVRCDSCGEEYLYKPGDILRNEMVILQSFVPHPLFR